MKMNRYQLFDLALKKHQTAPTPSMFRLDKIADEEGTPHNGSATSLAARTPTNHTAKDLPPATVTPTRHKILCPAPTSVATDNGNKTPGESNTQAADKNNQK
jgi:hypothetical protein